MKVAELKEKIEKLASEMISRDKTDLLNYLKFMKNFRGYSFYNSFMIFRCRPNATEVAGFKKWQDLGRYVKKGEKGIPILFPIFETKEEFEARTKQMQDKGIDNFLDSPAIKNFGVGYVFDVTQTDGKPLHEDPCELKGKDVNGLLPVLEDIAKDNNIKVDYEYLGGQVKGYSANGVIKVERDSEEMEKVATLIHELAHEFLHQRNLNKNEISKEVREAEAESVSYVVLSEYGIESKAPLYLYTYLKENQKVITETLNTIKSTIDYLLSEIEKRRNSQVDEVITA